ncbi:diacylglycerol kinase, partial [Staphylococcus hyicus]
MIKRFKPAFIGAITLLKKDKNFLIHLCIAIVVLSIALLFNLNSH